MGFLKRHPILTILLLFILAGFIWSLSHLHVSLQKKSLAAGEIKEKLRIIKRLAGTQPTEEMLNYLNSKSNTLSAIYERIKKGLTSPLSAMPEGVPFEGVVFKGMLSRVKKELTRKAEEKNFNLPKSIGFEKYDASIPQTEELPNLTRQLQAAETLITLMMDTGVEDLTTISFSEPIDRDLPGKSGSVYYKQFPALASVKCTMTSLAKFLYNLSRSDYIFVVKSVQINEAENKKINVELEILDIVFL